MNTPEQQPVEPTMLALLIEACEPTFDEVGRLRMVLRDHGIEAAVELPVSALRAQLAAGERADQPDDLAALHDRWNALLDRLGEETG